MGNNDMNLVVKILLVVAVVFCGLTLITPWINPGGYTWGADYGTGEWDIFYINSFSSEFWQIIFLGIAMIVTFFISLAALILGILAIKNIGVGKTRTSLTAGIISIIAVIFFLVAINVVAGDYAMYVGYSFGFFMMIFSSVMFFVSYGISFVTTNIQSTSVPPVAAPQQMYYQPPAPTPPQQGQPPMQPMPQQTPPPVTPPPPQPQPAQQQPDVAQKFCPECGTKIQGNPKFCPECGKKIA